MSSVTSTIKLNNGADMPVIGLGTAGSMWRNDAEAAKAVRHGLEVGYRMLDTAEAYQNENGVGQGIRDSGIDRSQIFITTKFDLPWHGRDLVRDALASSLKRLQTDYVDMYLIHWPNPAENRFVDAWRGLTDLLREGRVRAIGMSNFKRAHLERILTESDVRPDVNQIQLNPSIARSDERAFHARHGIVTQAWTPTGKAPLRNDATVRAIAGARSKTPTQIVLRWHIDLGIVPLPCSHVRSHLKENLALFDFSLTEAELKALGTLDGTAENVLDSDVFGH